jgi:hypothetical protein
MSRGLLTRSRLLIGCAGAVFAMVSTGAGCSATTPAVTVSARTLTIYVSAPSSLSPQGKDVADAEELAFNQLKGQVHGFTLRSVQLTDTNVSNNARRAIGDTTSAVAYLGEIPPANSVDSLGITNAQDLLQVSPAEAASVPTKDFESFSTYGRTFASMSLSQDVRALLAGSAGKTFVSDFRSAYGHAPSSQAILGYAAMATVLKALQGAGAAANNRGTVRANYFAPPKNAQLSVGPGGPVLGTYAVNKNGTVTITP